MANIKSINGNSIVLDANGIENDTITDSKLKQKGGVLAETNGLKNVMNKAMNIPYGWFKHTANHSSNDDVVEVNVQAGETFSFIVETSTGESLSGTAVFKDGAGNQTDTKAFTTNTLTSLTFGSGVGKTMGVYLPAGSSPCDVYIRVYHSDSIPPMVDTMRDEMNYVLSKAGPALFAVGELETAIEMDTVSKTVNIPAGYFFYKDNQSPRQIPAMNNVYFGGVSVQLLCVNFDNNTYELIPYTEFRSNNRPVVIVLITTGSNFFYKCVTPHHLVVDGRHKYAYRAEESIDTINNQLDASYAAWNARAGNTHSSAVDLVDVDIKTGDTFYINVKTSTNEEVSGTAVARDSEGNAVYTIGSITTGRIIKFTAVRDFLKIGLFLNAVSSDCTVYLNVIGDNSLYKIAVDDSSGVPRYWIDNLNLSIQKVADLQTYGSGVTFGFITDIHWETNHQMSPKLIEYISRNSRVDMWLNGGDTASGDGGNGTEQKHLLYDCIGKFGNGYKLYSINGNHDPNWVGGQVFLTDGEIRNTIMPYYDGVTFGGGNYYWFDYRGTRFVCLDTKVVGASDPTQVAWAADVIANSPLPVIVAMHIVYVSGSDSEPCAMFNELISAIGSNSNVKMIVAGHLHGDRSFIASNGIPVLILDTDSRFADDGIIRVKGTISEQCFSIITVNYGTERINVTRVGSVGSDMTVDY